jgi:MFS family permease
MTAASAPAHFPAPPRRWAVLVTYMFVTLVLEIQWVALAPVTRAAERFYGSQLTPGSWLNVDLLAMLYLLVFLVACVPASYVIDTYGIRIGVGAGATLAAVGGLLKGVLAANFLAVVAGQLLLAIAQPFVINAASTVAARWFPLHERGLANGLAALAQYLGIVAAMVIGPLVVVGDADSPRYGQGVGTLLLAYGIASCVAALAGLILVPERPEHPVEGGEERLGSFAGMKSLVAGRDYRILLVLFTAGLGIFNAMSTMVDTIAAHVGVQDSDGLIGTFLMVGGILGAIVLPIASDKAGKRRPFLILCMAGMVPGVAGLAFANHLASTPAGAYLVAKIAAGILGFFVMSAGPIGFQYAAEIGRPAPESSSQGMLLLVGQASGIAFMLPMESARLVGPMLALFTVLAVACFLGTFLLRESKLLAAPGQGAVADAAGAKVGA